MNKGRRKQINAIVSTLQELNASIEELQGDEEEARDNLPESLIDSEQYEKSDNACNELQYAFDELESVIEHLEEAAQ